MKYFYHYLATLDRSATFQIRRNKAYRALLATTIIAGSQLLSAISATANPVPNPSIPSPLLPTRTILNGSFEQPVLTPWNARLKSVSTDFANFTSGDKNEITGRWRSNTSIPANEQLSTTDVHSARVREAYLESTVNSAALPIIWRTTESTTNRPSSDDSCTSNVDSYDTTNPNDPKYWEKRWCYANAIEVWRGVPYSPGGPYVLDSSNNRLREGQNTTPSGAGVQYAEINGSDNATLYQDICVAPTDTVNWSLKHAVRRYLWDYDNNKVNLSTNKTTSFSNTSSGTSGTPSTADSAIAGVFNPTNIMQVSITNPALWANGDKTAPTNQTNAYYSADASSKATTNVPYVATTYNNGWKTYNGSWLASNMISSPKKLRFGFRAIQGSATKAGATMPTHGNFIDDVQLSLPALIDFLPPDPDNNVNIATTTEGNATNYYYLSLRINGATTTAGKVTIALTGLNQYRSFRLGTVKKGTATLTGLTAIKDGNSIKLDIPAGTYDPNSPSDYIHIPIDFSDTRSEPTDNLLFTLQSVDLGNLTIDSTQCATPRITVETKLIDDDFQKRVERPVELPFKIAAH